MGRNQPGNHPQQGRFPAAGGTDDGHEFSGLDLKTRIRNGDVTGRKRHSGVIGVHMDFLVRTRLDDHAIDPGGPHSTSDRSKLACLNRPLAVETV